METPAWVVGVLQANGLAGVVIFALAVAIVVIYRQGVAVNTSRLGERDVLLSALAANTSAINDNARVTEERNDATEKLADVIGRQGDVFDLFTANAKYQQELIKDQTAAQTKTIEALAESNRVNTGILRDVRDKLQQSAAVL